MTYYPASSVKQLFMWREGGLTHLVIALDTVNDIKNISVVIDKFLRHDRYSCILLTLLVRCLFY